MEKILESMEVWLAAYGLKLIAAILIYIVGRWGAKLVKKVVQRVMTNRKVEPAISSFVTNLCYFGVMIFVIIAALSQVGVETTSAIAVIGAAGLAVGLALQGALANFAAGFLMLIFKPFKVDDFIEGGGASGIVEELHIFTTQLRTPDNKLVIIPNAKIMGDNIINYSAKDKRRVDFSFGVGYNDDLKKVRKVLQSIIDEETRVLKEEDSMIAVGELGDSSVNFTVRVWVRPADYWGVYFDTTEKVKLRFDAEGIGIPFPQRDVHIYETK